MHPGSFLPKSAPWCINQFYLTKIFQQDEKDIFFAHRQPIFFLQRPASTVQLQRTVDMEPDLQSTDPRALEIRRDKPRPQQFHKAGADSSICLERRHPIHSISNPAKKLRMVTG